MDETLDQALQRLEIKGPVSHGLLHIFPLRVTPIRSRISPSSKAPSRQERCT